MIDKTSEFKFEGPFRSIPSLTRHNLEAYLRYGQLPGGFLESVLSGKLYRAIEVADLENVRSFGHLVNWIRKFAPLGSYGCEQNFQDWHQRHGLAGVV